MLIISYSELFGFDCPASLSFRDFVWHLDRQIINTFTEHTFCQLCLFIFFRVCCERRQHVIKRGQIIHRMCIIWHSPSSHLSESPWKLQFVHFLWTHFNLCIQIMEVLNILPWHTLHNDKSHHQTKAVYLDSYAGGDTSDTLSGVANQLWRMRREPRKFLFGCKSGWLMTGLLTKHSLHGCFQKKGYPKMDGL